MIYNFYFNKFQFDIACTIYRIKSRNYVRLFTVRLHVLWYALSLMFVSAINEHRDQWVLQLSLWKHVLHVGVHVSTFVSSFNILALGPALIRRNLLLTLRIASWYQDAASLVRQTCSNQHNQTLYEKIMARQNTDHQFDCDRASSRSTVQVNIAHSTTVSSLQLRIYWPDCALVYCYLLHANVSPLPSPPPLCIRCQCF